MSYFLLNQLPILLCSAYATADLSRAVELTYTSHSMAPFARDLDYDGPPFAWDKGRRAQLCAAALTASCSPPTGTPPSTAAS